MLDFPQENNLIIITWRETTLIIYSKAVLFAIKEGYFMNNIKIYSGCGVPKVNINAISMKVQFLPFSLEVNHQL